MKKNVKYLFLPIIIFSIFALVDFPKSHAKYIKKESNISLYSGTKTIVKKLGLKDGEYNSDGLSIGFDDKTSTIHNAVFRIDIPRNNIMYSTDKLDTYRINIESGQNSCYIVDGSTSGTGNPDIDEHDSYTTISYDTVNNSEVMSLEVNCSVIDDPIINNQNKYIYLTMEVDEQITNINNQSEEIFTYFKYQHNVVLSDYYRGNRIPPSDETALYTNAISAIENNYSSLGDTYLGYIKDYFRSVFYAGIKNDEFIANKDNLVGFSYDDINGYVFDSNFAGYAITWKRYQQSEDKTDYKFYFSTTDSDERKTAFSYYLNTYSSEALKTYGLNKVTDFINLYPGGLDSAFTDDIYRILVASDEYGMVWLNYTDNIMTMINNRYSEYKSMVNNKDVGTRPYDTFRIAVNNYYRSSLTNNLVASMRNDTSLQESALRNFNNTTTDYTKFADYFFYTDSTTDPSNQKSILLEVYSDATGSYNSNVETYTYFRLFTLATGEQIVLANPIGSTINNMTVFEVINEINNIAHSGVYTPITSFGDTYTTSTDSNNIEHRLYTVNGVDYETYTKDGIEYTIFVIE